MSSPQRVIFNIPPLEQIRFAKTVDPDIFKDKTPHIHLRMLEFVNRPTRRKKVKVFRGAGKTTLLNKVHLLCRVFFYHEKHTLIAANTMDKAKNFISELKNMADKAREKGFDIRYGYKKDKSRGIQKNGIDNDAQVDFLVDGKYICRVSAISPGGDPRGLIVDNNRPTFLLCDDLETKVPGRYCVLSKETRERLERWFFADLLPSLDPRANALFLGTPLHKDALLEKLKWEEIVIPIITEDGKSAWPSRFPTRSDDPEIESIEKIRADLVDAGLSEVFWQEYLMVPQDKERQFFKRDDFKYFKGIEWDTKTEYVVYKLARGELKELVRKPLNIILDDGTKIPITSTVRYTTTDPASDGKDKTAIVTCAYDSNGNRYILEIRVGRWGPFDKSVKCIAVQKELEPLGFGVEKSGGLNDLFDSLDEAQKATGVRLNIVPHTTGGVAKNIRIANLEPSYRTGHTYHNRSDPMTDVLEAQLCAFDIDVEADEDDIIDALAQQTRFVTGKSFDETQDDDSESMWYEDEQD